MTDRAEFLERVRREMAKTRGLFAAETAERPADPAAVVESIRRQLAERWPVALARFKEEFERVGGVLYHVEQIDDVPPLVKRIAAERDARRVLTWAGSVLSDGLIDRLRAVGLEVTEQALEGTAETERSRFREAAAEAEIGVTGVDIAVAETGSLVVISGRGKARVASLLPPYHVAIFGKAALVESLEQVGVMLEALHRDPHPSMSGASISFVTGPSRTADIELTLTRGVHGPKEVHAVFVASL